MHTVIRRLGAKMRDGFKSSTSPPLGGLGALFPRCLRFRHLLRRRLHHLPYRASCFWYRPRLLPAENQALDPEPPIERHIIQAMDWHLLLTYESQEFRNNCAMRILHLVDCR